MQGFTVFAVTKIRCAGNGSTALTAGGLAVYLDGGPLDGSEEEIPLGGAGVITSRAMPDGCGAERIVDYVNLRTKTKRPAGRVVCRYSGGRVRA
jgi:hypothetical protein